MDSDQAAADIYLINDKMITEEGKREWADVLSSKVEGISYADGILITLSGCSEERLKKFGSCFSDFDQTQGSVKWFCNPDEPMPKHSVSTYEKIDNREFEVRYAKHILWLNDIPGGEQADFSGCILENINLADRDIQSFLGLFKNI